MGMGKRSIEKIGNRSKESLQVQIRVMGKGRWAVEKVGNRTRSLYRKQEGDSHHHGSSVVHDSVVALQQKWTVGCCCIDEDSDDHDDDNDPCNGSTNLFISPKWLSQPFGMTVSGFWISAGIPFVPISLALPADKREYGDANQYLAFTRYDGIIPQSPIGDFGHGTDLPPVNSPVNRPVNSPEHFLDSWAEGKQLQRSAFKCKLSRY